MFKVTKEWLEINCTEKGGYTRKQLEILGIEWPPKSGWKELLIGTEITDDVRIEFDLASWRWTERGNNPKSSPMVKVGCMNRGKGKVFGSAETLWGVMTPEGFEPAEENWIGGADKLASNIRKKRMY